MQDLKLIGREKELKALGDRLREFLAEAGRRQALWLNVSGEDGIGKTRLLRELMIEARRLSEIRLLRMRDHGLGGFPFGAVTSALCDNLGLTLWENEYSRKEKLESRLAGLSSLRLPADVFEAESVLPVFGQLLGVSYPLEFQTGVPRRGKGRLRVFNAVRRYLQALRAGGEAPGQDPPLTVLWFDDLDRLDQLSIELLVHLVQKKETLWPLAVISSSTGSFSGRLGHLEEFREFSLAGISRLSRRKIVESLESVSGAGALSPGLRKSLIEGTPGNPGLLIEAFLLAAEKSGGPGSVDRKKALQTALESKSRALDMLELPGVLRSRLHPLPPFRKRVLQIIAVLGPYVSVETLSGLLAREGKVSGSLEDELDALAAEGLIQDYDAAGSDGTVRMANPLAREIVIDTMPAERLTSLRHHCAEFFHSLAEGEGRDLDFLLGDLLSGSFLLKTGWAVDVLASCGERCCQLEDYDNAVRVLDEALARLGLERTEASGGGNGRFNSLMVLSARALLGAGRLKEAFGRLVAARGLAMQDESGEALVGACIELGEIMQVRGDWTGAQRYFDEALAAAEAAGERALIADCLVSSGKLNTRREEYGGAESFFRRALELCAGEALQDRRLEILLNLAYIHQQSERFDKAVKLYDEALELARARHDEAAAVTALSNLGRIRYEQEELEDALELFHQALRLLKSVGGLQQTGNWLGYIGSIYYSMEEYETAIDYYEQALSLARKGGNLRNQGIWLANLGNAYYEIKELARALEYYLAALEFAREEQDYSYVSTLLSTIGVYYYNLKQYDQARRYFENSLALARETGNLPIMVQSILYLGSIRAAADDEKAGRRLIDEGGRLAEEHGMADHRAVAALFRARIELEHERRDKALKHCREAAELAGPTGNRKLMAEIERARAACGEQEPPPQESKS